MSKEMFAAQSAPSVHLDRDKKVVIFDGEFFPWYISADRPILVEDDGSLTLTVLTQRVREIEDGETIEYPKPPEERRDADYWANEREDLLERFRDELAKATGDGSKKRQAGAKPPWYEDDSHEGAVFSHITKWKRGEKVDPDSGAHPLVHAAWRLLAIACSENGNHP